MRIEATRLLAQHEGQEEPLFQLAFDAVPDVCIHAVSHLQDQDHLFQVAQRTTNEDVGECALARIDDAAAKARLITEAQDRRVRYKAFQAIEGEPGLLAAVARVDGDYAALAIDLISDEEVFRAVAADPEAGIDRLGKIASKTASPATIETLFRRFLDGGVFLRDYLPVIVDKSEHQDLLAACAGRPDIRLRVRLAAIGRISDQAHLAEIAKSQIAEIRVAAVQRIGNQTLLTRLARADKSPLVRIAAIARLTNQKTIVLIARKTKEDRAVRCAAISRIEDQAVLAEIAQDQKRDTAERETAVARLQDQGLLREIALEDADTYASDIAAKRVTDPSVIAELAILGRRLSAEQIASISDQAVLYEIALHCNRGDLVRAAVESITDQGRLCEIVLKGRSDSASAEAVRKITDPTQLRRIFTEESGNQIRQLALGNIADEDQELLVDGILATQFGSAPCLEQQLRRVVGREAMSRIAHHRTDRHVRQKALELLSARA